MKLAGQKEADLARRHDKVLQTPASFAFFVAIHDFVKYIEEDSALSRRKLPNKYDQLKEVYQGVEDKDIQTNEDLGHDRYMTIQDLNRIQREDVSEGNPLWKKREVLRAAVGEVFETLRA